MAKKELVSDIPEFDTDFNFDFENEIDGELNQEATGKKKARGVIGNVFMGTVSGVKDAVVSPEFVKDTLRKTLPDSYGEVADATGELTTGMYELYDETVREIKPRVGRVTAKINQLVPESAKRLKSLTEKIARWGGIDIGGEQNTVPNQEEQAVAMSLAGVFEQQQEQGKLDNAKDLIRDRIGAKRFNANFDLQRSMERSLSIQTQYTVNTNQRFQRKSLELQIRSLLAQKEHFSKAQASFKVFQTQLEAVVKNTAMPEYVKITESERFKEVSKKKFIESLYGDKSFLKKGMDRLKETARQTVSGFTSALDTADMQLDSAIDAKEMLDGMNASMVDMGMEPMSKAEMLGATAGANIAEWFRDVMAKRIKQIGGDDSVIQEKFAGLANIANNPAGAIEKLRQSQNWVDKTNEVGAKGKFFRALDMLMDNFTDRDPGRSIGSETNLDELDNPTMGFDAKAHISLTDIIPGHLANIHREIVMLRTGRNQADRQVYDFKRKEFTSETDMGARVEKDLASHIQRSGYNYIVEKAVELFTENENLDEDQIIELKRFLSRLSRDSNNPLDPDSILSSPSFGQLSDELQDLIEYKLRSSEQSDTKNRDANTLTKAIKDIRKRTPSSDKTIAGFEKAGYGDLIAKKGLAKKRDDGKYDIDEEAYAKFMEDSAFIRSDINVKEAIKELNPKELLQAVSDRFKGAPGSQDYKDLAARYFGQKSKPDKEEGFFDKVKRFNPREAYEGIKKTKLFNWNYQAGKGDDQEHSGPMAQEVRKNLGEEVAPKGKMIDLQSMNGALMASIQHLGEKVEGLFKRDAAPPETTPKSSSRHRTKGKSAEELTNELLAKIQKDTADTVKLLTEQQKLASELVQSGGQGAGGFIPNQLVHDGTFRGMITSIMRGTMDLGFKAGSSTIEALKEFFTPGEKTEKAKGLFTSAKDFLKDQLTDKESGTRKAFSTLYEKAASFSSTVFDSAKSFLTEGLPNGLKFIKDKVSKVFGWVGDKLNEAKDLYLPDGVEPVIRAVKLKAGFYRDAVTGEVLDTMDKLNKAKGDIVDSVGNIILSLEERSKGLYDRYGDKIRGNVTNVIRLATKAAAWVGDKARKGFNVLTDKSLSMGGKIKEWWDQPTDWGQFGINFGENKYAKDTYEVLLDIRDIMLNQRVNVLKRIKKRESAKLKVTPPGGPVDKAPKNLNEVLKEAKDEVAIKSAEIKEKTAELKNKIKGFFGFGKGGAVSEEVAKDFVGPMQPGVSTAAIGTSSGSLLSRGMDFFKNKENFTDLKGKGRELGDKLLGRTPEDFVGPMQPGDKKKGLFNKAKYQYSALKTKHTATKTQRPDEFVGPIYPGARQKDAIDRGISDLQPNETYQDRIDAMIQAAKDRFKQPSWSTPKAQSPGDFVGPRLPDQMGPAKPSRFKLAQGKARGLLGTGAAMAGGLASSIGGFLKGGEKGAAAATPENQPQVEKKPSLLKRVKQKIDSAKRAWNDTDGSGTRDGSIEEREEKLAELKASRQKEGAQADLTARYKGGTGLMDLLGNGLKMAMTGFGGLFSLITKGLGGVMGLAGKLLAMTPGALVKGVGGVAKLAGKGAWGAAKLAGKGALGLGRFALTRALPGLAMGALNVAGGAIGAVASVISSPVILGAAAIAGAGYGLYKLYQYATRNNADEFERIRLNQYGFGYNQSVDQYNYYPFMLEAYLEDGRVGYDNGKAYINDKKVKSEELLELFKIDKEDTEQGEKFSRWFDKRFKPFFLTHMTALYAVNNKAKLKEVAKFKPDDRIKYLELVGFESGPYDEDTSPVKALSQLSLDNKFVKDSIEALIAKAKADKPKDTKATLPPAKLGETTATSVAKTLFDKLTFGVFKDKEKESQIDQAQKAKVEEERRKNAEQNKAQVQTATQSEDGGAAPASTTAREQGSEEKSLVGGAGKVAMAPGAPLEGTAGRQFVKFEKKGINIDSLNPTMLKLFLGMAEEYGKNTGKSILVTSGVRTYEEQVEMKRKYGDRAAAPGNSLHEFGLALDIDSKIADELDKLGLMKKYGFTRPVGQEPWHVEPAGIQKNPSEAKTNGQLRDAMISAGVMRGGAGYGSMANSAKGRRNKDVALGLLNAPPSPVASNLQQTAKDQVLPPPKFSEAVKAETTSTNTVDTAVAVKKASDQNAKAGTPPSKDAKLSMAQNTAAANSTTNDLPPPDAEEKPASTGGKATTASAENGASGDIKAQIASHAKRAGEDPALMQAFAAVESDMNPQAKASTSSAAGLFQFIRSTWDSMVSKYSSKYGLEKTASPFSVEASSLMAAEYIKENKKVIAPVKSNPNLTDLYLAHFLGASGAKAFLSMPPDAIAANRFPGPASKNQNIFYKDGKPLTVKQVYDNLSAKLNEKSSRYGVKAPTGSLGLSAAPSKGPGLDIDPAQSPISTPMAGEKVSAQKAAVANAGPAAGQKKAPEPKSSSSGLFLDNRTPGVVSTGRTESGEGMAAGFGSLSTALDKSVGIQQESLVVLREILSNVKVEKVAEMMATVVSATTKAAKAGDEKASPKEQDRINLGRKDKSGSSALDMRRTM